MMTDRQKMAAKIDAKIEQMRQICSELDKQAAAAEQNGEIAKFHELHISALNAWNDFEYWRNYKADNPILWQEETPPPLPDITKRQIKLWLLKKGKDPKSIPAETIAKISDAELRAQAEIEWEDGSVYARESPFVKALAAALSWPEAELEKAWRQIAAIE